MRVRIHALPLCPCLLYTSRRFDIGFVFQFYNLVPNLTAKENVELATQISKNPMDSTEAVSYTHLDVYKRQIH